MTKGDGKPCKKCGTREWYKNGRCKHCDREGIKLRRLSRSNKKFNKKKCNQCKESKQLTEYQQSNLSDDGMDTWCNDCLELIRSKMEYQPVLDSDTFGYVYLIYSGSGHYKIGISKNPEKRLIDLQGTTGPYELSIIKTKTSENMYKEEFLLHEKYKDYRVRGEWFLLDPNSVQSLLNDFNNIK